MLYRSDQKRINYTLTIEALALTKNEHSIKLLNDQPYVKINRGYC